MASPPTLPPNIGQLPDLMKLCREHALLGNYQVALELHGKADKQVNIYPFSSPLNTFYA